MELKQQAKVHRKWNEKFIEGSERRFPINDNVLYFTKIVHLYFTFEVNYWIVNFTANQNILS